MAPFTQNKYFLYGSIQLNDKVEYYALSLNHLFYYNLLCIDIISSFKPILPNQINVLSNEQLGTTKFLILISHPEIQKLANITVLG